MKEAHEIIEEHGNVKYIYRVPVREMNQRVEEFMNSPREFTAYPADRIELIARHYNLVPQNAYYKEFDVSGTGNLIFVVNNRSHGEPRWLENTKSFIRKLFS